MPITWPLGRSLRPAILVVANAHLTVILLACGDGSRSAHPTGNSPKLKELRPRDKC
jgi:hypothetical protein